MTKVKICGLTRKWDIDSVNAVLPDYAGFVFAKSKRMVDVITARQLKSHLDPQIKAVGVFVNQPVELVASIWQNGIIDIVQLHGDEDEAYILQLKKICDCKIIKAVAVGDSLPLLPKAVDYLLFDTLSSERGGSGRVFDWNLLNNYNGPPYFLAGGIDVNNVNVAVRKASPFCVDISSGVETDGFKDAAKIAQFVNIVRNIKGEMEK